MDVAASVAEVVKIMRFGRRMYARWISFAAEASKIAVGNTCIAGSSHTAGRVRVVNSRQSERNVCRARGMCAAAPGVCWELSGQGMSALRTSRLRLELVAAAVACQDYCRTLSTAWIQDPSHSLANTGDALVARVVKDIAKIPPQLADLFLV